jgi:hypothetical protein
VANYRVSPLARQPLISARPKNGARQNQAQLETLKMKTRIILKSFEALDFAVVISPLRDQATPAPGGHYLPDIPVGQSTATSLCHGGPTANISAGGALPPVAVV